MAVDRTFTLKNGTELELTPVKSATLAMLIADSSGKPQPPLVRTKKGRKERNPDDPDYKAALDEWQREKNGRMYYYMITRGIANEPPREAYEEVGDLVPDGDPKKIKYYWITEQVEDDEELEALTDAITGMTEPTQEGLEEARETFPGDGQRD